MTEPTQLFPRPDAPRPDGDDQLSLFGAAGDRMQPPAPPPPAATIPEPTEIRRRLHALLTVARQAQAMPWPDRHARMWQTVFPQMANWLPDEEADQLRFEFAVEMERLKAA